MRRVIITGRRVTAQSPIVGREDAELWGVTRCAAKFWRGQLPGWTRWFDTHPLTTTRRFLGMPERRRMAWDWYLQQDGSRPIYLQDPKHASSPEKARALFDRVPGAVPFPLEQIREFYKLPSGERESWWTCLLGELLAFAGMEGFEQVILSGIGTVNTMNSQHAHRCTEYWIGYLRGRGVDVRVEGPSIYRQPTSIYAYEHVRFPDLEARKTGADRVASYRQIRPGHVPGREAGSVAAKRLPKNHKHYRKDA